MDNKDNDSKNKEEAYSRIKSALLKYSVLIKPENWSFIEGDSGKEFFSCWDEILNNLKYFPDLVNEDDRKRLLDYIQTYRKDYFSVFSNGPKNILETKIGELYTDNEDYKIIAHKIFLQERILEQMEALKHIVEDLNTFFGEIKEKIVQFYQKNEDLHRIKGVQDLIYDYQSNCGSNIRDGKIGNMEYIYMTDLPNFIYTEDGMYYCDFYTDNEEGKECVYYFQVYLKNGERERLEIFKAVDGSDWEKVINKTKNEKYIMKSNEVLIIRGDTTKRYRYNPETNLWYSEDTQSSAVEVGSGLSELTIRAIQGNIKGVIPEEILQIYESRDPSLANLIKDYKNKSQRPLPDGSIPDFDD